MEDTDLGCFLIFILVILGIIFIPLFIFGNKDKQEKIQEQPKQSQCIKMDKENDNDRTKALELLSIINEYRYANDLPQLERTEPLEAAANHKAYEYSINRQWAHDINGKTFDQIVRECDVQYEIVGENLARDFDTPKQVFDAWLKSPTHKKELDKKDFKKVGLFFGNESINNYTVLIMTN